MSCKRMHISEICNETSSNIRNKQRQKTHDSENNIEKTFVFMISERYLCIYVINHAIKELPARKLR